MPVNRFLTGLYMPIKWRLAVLMADREIDYKDLAEKIGFDKRTVNKHKNMRTMPKRLEETTDELSQAMTIMYFFHYSR